MMRSVVLALSVGLLASLVWAQAAPAPKALTSNDGKDAAADKQPGPDQPTSGSWNAPDYVIGADDTLHISVWKEPDLSVTLPVRPDGKISMPLLDDIPAAGMTPVLLKELITARLKKYIADPRVTVVVTAMNSRRIFVTGEVLHTGPMPLLPNMTMLQALAQAGFNQFSNLKGIYLLRTENGKQQKIPFNYKEVVKGNRPEQNIVLKPGDTVVVP
ncbi:MAG TPA: polysaccharide biosynthesis/export family protein [Dongiaceae bacterium]|nr:polysaccharide biosynthesis/export family protein [Dongiaceae bacterium]